ncbi:hypothetical protein B0H17DRAFT_1126559 [Mycena rosella]|uniref:Uncharacterized protein n=1 Tax=Mycena rosella TaxID=1033263 RepID=A0AAD7M7T1_MYCRO|nr:hypothetical protein B0H17DRAFT_1126559 [Mycena rosella]
MGFGKNRIKTGINDQRHCRWMWVRKYLVQHCWQALCNFNSPTGQIHTYEVPMHIYGGMWERLQLGALLRGSAKRSAYHSTTDHAIPSREYAIPFSIYVRMSNVPIFRMLDIPDVEHNSLPTTLELGYATTGLSWMGGPATRTISFNLVGKILRLPYASTFLAKGGIRNKIALWIDSSLAAQFAKGPSSGINEYGCSFMKRGEVTGTDGVTRDELLTREQVLDSKNLLIHGSICMGKPEKDLYLFPPQRILESECPEHFTGKISGKGLKYIEYLFD